MSRWLVELQGDRMDLEEFHKRFPSGEVHAIEEGGKFFLAGPAFNALLDADAVRNRATEALNEFSGIISLLWNSFRKPNIGPAIHEDDAGKLRYFVPLTGIQIRTKIGVMAAGGKRAPLATGTVQAQDLLSAARRNPFLYTAFNIWSTSIRSWSHLRRIMEEIEKFLEKQVHKAGLCGRNERQRFMQTTHSHKAAGVDALHAGDPPKNPMSLAEARSFVNRLLLEVLKKEGGSRHE
jgi:hypothetical protein